MSELKVNQISKRSGNNISLSDPLRLKSYTTSERDALTGLNNGDMIFNSTDGKAQIYGSGSWTNAGGVDAFSIEYLIVAGGGGGGSGRNSAGNGNGGGGGGAGGLLTNVQTDESGGQNTAQPPMYIQTGDSYEVTVGSGGANGGGAYTVQPSNERSGYGGGKSQFGQIRCRGGAGGLGRNGSGNVNPSMSGGGFGGSGANASSGSWDDEQGSAGGSSYSNYKHGGGGGAGGVGVDYNQDAKNGGIGLVSTIITSSEATTYSVGEVSGSDVYFAGGGGSAKSYVVGEGNTTNGSGGLGGGGDSVNFNGATAGGTNTGGGGAGGRDRNDGYGWEGSAGGSGVVILRYPSDYTISVGAGLTSTTFTQGSNKVTIFTAGDDTVSWS